jgi:hypothetical protein
VEEEAIARVGLQSQKKGNLIVNDASLNLWPSETTKCIMNINNTGQTSGGEIEKSVQRKYPGCRFSYHKLLGSGHFIGLPQIPNKINVVEVKLLGRFGVD